MLLSYFLFLTLVLPPCQAYSLKYLPYIYHGDTDVTNQGRQNTYANEEGLAPAFGNPDEDEGGVAFSTYQQDPDEVAGSREFVQPWQSPAWHPGYLQQRAVFPEHQRQLAKEAAANTGKKIYNHSGHTYEKYYGKNKIYNFALH